MEKILFILGLHYIADFSLQGEFLFQMKGKRLYILFAHSIIYATIISMGLAWFAAFESWKFFALLISHMVVDKWKTTQPQDDAHWHLLYYDQIIHIAINLILLYI